MGCYSCGGNPNTFCRDCTYPKDTWIAPVDSLPDPFMGDFDHLFRTPDGNMYALSPDRTHWILMGGAGGTVQKPQNLELNNGTRELTITRGNTVTLPNDTQNLSINGRTITISNGNAINLPEDRDTVYNDAELRRRIQAVEDKADNFVSGVTVSREGNKVKLTYTFVNGAPKEVEFEDKDTISLAYDDTALKARVKALEDKTDKDTVYDDRDLKRRLDDLEARPYPGKTLYDRIDALEAKPDNDKQNLSLDANTRVLSISNGNNVTLPNDKQTITKEGNKLILSNGGGEVELPQSNNTQPYDDTHLKARLSALEAKQDRDNQTLTINNRTLSISGGNSITLPEDRDTVYNDADIKRRLTALEGKTDNFVTGVTASRTGNKVKLTYNFVTGQPKTVEFDDKDTISVAYDDTALRNRIQALEGRPDTNTVLRLSKNDISGGNVGATTTIQKSTLVNPDDVKVGDTVQDYWSGSTGANTEFFKVTAVNGNNVTLQKVGQWELRNDKQTISKQGNKIVLSNGGGEVDIPTATPYNDADIKRRLGVLEAKRDNDNQTLSITNNRLTISNGNSVEIPQPNLNNYVTVNQYNELKDAFTKLLEDLKGSGAWEQTGDTIFKGNLKPNRHLATGNINLFGGQPDGNAFIRTNNGSTENDLAGGIS